MNAFKRGFFIIELMIGFFMLQLIIATAAGYVTHQVRTYARCLERLHMLDQALTFMERCWLTQSISPYVQADDYVYSYESVKIVGQPELRYGLVTIKPINDDHATPIILPIGTMNMVII